MSGRRRRRRRYFLLFQLFFLLLMALLPPDTVNRILSDGCGVLIFNLNITWVSVRRSSSTTTSTALTSERERERDSLLAVFYSFSPAIISQHLQLGDIYICFHVSIKSALELKLKLKLPLKHLSRHGFVDNEQLLLFLKL